MAELDRIGWEDEPSEKTPIDSGNLKQMENNTEKYVKEEIAESLEITRITTIVDEEIKENTDYTISKSYTVGKNNLLVFFEGCLLKKDENYIEVGENNSTSTTIQFKDWDVPVGSKLEFIYK